MIESRFRRITAAIDGSPEASEALLVAIDLAKQYGSELQILAVAPLVPVYVASAEPFVPAGVAESDVGRFRELVEAAVKQAEAAGVTRVTGLADEGAVVEEILAILQQHPTDLLVVGSRGLSATKRLLLGSVSTALVTHAPCPVLVVRGVVTQRAG